MSTTRAIPHTRLDVEIPVYKGLNSRSTRYRAGAAVRRRPHRARTSVFQGRSTPRTRRDAAPAPLPVIRLGMSLLARFASISFASVNVTDTRTAIPICRGPRGHSTSGSARPPGTKINRHAFYVDSTEWPLSDPGRRGTGGARMDDPVRPGDQAVVQERTPRQSIPWRTGSRTLRDQ